MDLGSPLINATAVFVGFAIIVVFLLWLGGIYSKKLPPQSAGGKTVTLFGFFFMLVFVSILILIFSLEHVAPNLPSYYRTIALIIVLAIATFAEKIANRFGFKIIKSNNDKNV